MVIWLLLIPGLLALSVVITWLAHRDLNRPTPPCEHPWYINMRCMVCGEPR